MATLITLLSLWCSATAVFAFSTAQNCMIGKFTFFVSILVRDPPLGGAAQSWGPGWQPTHWEAGASLPSGLHPGYGAIMAPCGSPPVPYFRPPTTGLARNIPKRKLLYLSSLLVVYNQLGMNRIHTTRLLFKYFFLFFWQMLVLRDKLYGHQYGPVTLQTSYGPATLQTSVWPRNSTDTDMAQ